MHTQIGRGLSGVRAGAAAGVGLCAVLVHFWLVWLYRYPESVEGPWALAVICLATLFWLSGGDLHAIGFQFPAGGWLKWIRWSLLLGAVIAACLAAAAGLWTALGRRWPVYATAPAEAGTAFLRMCIFAPLLEESIYRVALCVPLAAITGPWRAIGASGLAFALLHVVYGNPSPENLLGGFLLAWAYLRSESVLVPVLLHAGGNLLVLVWQVGAWYWLVGQS